MSDNTSTARSKTKSSPADEIVELRPPPDIASSQTHKMLRHGNEKTIDEMVRRGYTIVTSRDDA